MKVKSLSRVRLFATPWTAAYQAPPSMGFSRQKYWSGVPSPSPTDLTRPLTKGDTQTASKHMKRCSTLYVIREMQRKTAARSHYTPIKTSENPWKSKCCAATGTLAPCWWEFKTYSHFGRWFGSFLQVLPQESSNCACGVYPKELETYVHMNIKTCTQMYVALLFIMVKPWKQPRCPSVGDG